MMQPADNDQENANPPCQPSKYVRFIRSVTLFVIDVVLCFPVFGTMGFKVLVQFVIFGLAAGSTQASLRVQEDPVNPFWGIPTRLLSTSLWNPQGCLETLSILCASLGIPGARINPP